MNHTASSQNSHFGATGVYESEAQRLQKEADKFTKNYEHEKKRLMVLEDQLKQATQELTEQKNRLDTIRPSTAVMNKDRRAIKQLEGELDKKLVSFNSVQAENKSLMREIDQCRR